MTARFLNLLSMSPNRPDRINFVLVSMMKIKTTVQRGKETCRQVKRITIPICALRGSIRLFSPMSRKSTTHTDTGVKLLVRKSISARFSLQSDYIQVNHRAISLTLQQM